MYSKKTKSIECLSRKKAITQVFFNPCDSDLTVSRDDSISYKRNNAVQYMLKHSATDEYLYPGI